MTTTKKKAAPLAMLASVYAESYGQIKLLATVVVPQANGELHGTSWGMGGSQVGAEYDGFQVNAYLGYSMPGSAEDRDRDVWGCGYTYRPHHIESLAQAQAIARVFGRINRGMARANTADGYIPDDDFAAYLLRVSRALGIREIYVVPSVRAQQMSGERARRTDGAGLQYWVSAIKQAFKDDTIRAEYIR